MGGLGEMEENEGAVVGGRRRMVELCNSLELSLMLVIISQAATN